VATFDFPWIEMGTFVGETNWKLGNSTISGLNNMILEE
jgi:hypothetical protein